MALTTAQIQNAYVAFFNRPADVAGLQYWSNYAGNSADLLNTFAQSAEYTGLYANMNATQLVSAVYQNLFGRAPEVSGLTYWVNQLDNGALKIGNIAEAINKGAQGTDSAIITNKVAAATAFTAALDTTPEIVAYASANSTALNAVKSWLNTVTSDVASVTTATGAALNTVLATVQNNSNQNVGQTFTLTTGTDTITGTAGNDTINASTGLSADGATVITTTNALDVINGGAGVDTLNIENTGGVNVLAGNVSDVENLTFVGAGNVNNNVAVVATPFSGVISLKQTNDLAVTVNNVTSQTLALNTVADDTVLTAALAASQASASLKSEAAVGTATFSISGAALKTVNLSVDKTAASESVVVTDTGNTTETANIAATGASAVTVTSTALKAVTVSGAGLVTLTTTTAPTVSVDASASTGGVTLATALAATASFTGGAGKDAITLGATTKVIAMGAGDDTVNVTTAALGAGGSLDGGEGSDTIALTAANAATATSTASLGAAFAASVSNFEKFGVGSVGAATVVDAQYIDGINHIVSAGSTAGSLTINNLANNSTFESTALQAAAVTLNLKDSLGSSDVLNLNFSAANGFTSTAAIIAAGVETLNITTDDTDTTAPTAVFDQEITASSVKSVVVKGDVGIDLTGLTATTLTSFDASGVTATGAAGAVTITTGALAAAASLTGGAGNDAINAAAATKAVTLVGGAGNDVLTGSSTIASSLTGGEGNDTLNGGAGADTINGGAGNDIISGGAGLDILTGGAGNDTFNIVANSNGNIYATVTDAAAGDVLSFTDLGNETFNKNAITLGGTAVFQDYLNEAAKGTSAVDGAISWFQFGGNTYVVEDVSAGTSFVNGSDSVVQLTGLVNLTNAVVGDHSLTLA
ncbi:DUF4214 domain-containing protein [Pseudidiomarina sp.]|uniref:DUF4214 domain-containing protein n=1 Tax=Pseudidiomarina sp. TaxID=2081707 RepID=UPI003A980321